MYILCKCKCKFDGKKCNSDEWWNNNKYWCECKKRHVCEKDYIWNPAACSGENESYLARIMADSVITSDEIFEEETKTAKTIFYEQKNAICKKKQNSIFYLPFY